MFAFQSLEPAIRKPGAIYGGRITLDLGEALMPRHRLNFMRRCARLSEPPGTGLAETMGRAIRQARVIAPFANGVELFHPCRE